MIDLLKNDLPVHYGLRRSNISVPSETTSEIRFDLTDEITTGMVVEYRTGNVSFERESATLLEVINYERFLNSLSGTSFEQGRKRCDYIMYEKTAENFFLLNEQTSTLGTTALLSKPILNKDKEVQYPGGKYEKVEVQLSGTLHTLMDVSSIATFIDRYKRKICLMSYIIKTREKEMPSAQKAFATRYRQVEARETGEDGALLECKPINDCGFEYRRISHDYIFRLSPEKP